MRLCKCLQLAFLKLCLLPIRASLETSWTPTVGSIPPSPSQKGWSILYPQDQRCNIIIFLIKYLQHFLCSYIEHISQSTIFCDSFGRPSPTTLWTAARAPCCLLDANSPKNENNNICDCQIIWSRFVGQQGHDIAHPGVAPIKMNGREPVYHKYYQVRPAPCTSAAPGR